MSDGFYTIYTPVLESKSGWFEVNGANSINKETAISRANRHSSVKDGSAKIARIDETYEFISWNSENNFLKG